MPDAPKNTLREGYDRLKKAFEKIMNPKKEQMTPQLIWQPCPDKKNLKGH